MDQATKPQARKSGTMPYTENSAQNASAVFRFSREPMDYPVFLACFLRLLFAMKEIATRALCCKSSVFGSSPKQSVAGTLPNAAATALGTRTPN